MKNKGKILEYQIIATICVILLGTLLHFTYEWSDNNVIVGLFSATNESTWEHLKIAFFPMLISTVVGYFLIEKDAPNILCAKTIGILSTMAFITISFYTLNGVIGVTNGFINIALFIIGVVLGEYIAYRIMTSTFTCNNKIAIIILALLFVCFILFTYFTPQIGIFKAPIDLWVSPSLQ